MKTDIDCTELDNLTDIEKEICQDNLESMTVTELLVGLIVLLIPLVILFGTPQ